MRNMDTSLEIKALRNKMKLNRKDFCTYFEISYRTVSDWETGKRTMPMYLLKLMKYKVRQEAIQQEVSKDDQRNN